MRENGLKTIAILGIIIGAVGLGFGAFATWQVQTGGAEGDDGDDGITTTIITYDNVIEYPCSSEAAINNALTAIGTGYGIITITANITLSGTIEIDGGGNYIIQSAGAIIKCASTKRAFYITNARSLTIQNIKIDTSDVTDQALSIIRIYEASDNPIYIRNVHIIGDSNLYGNCIYIISDNVWISECYFYKVRTPIYQMGGNSAHIHDNVIDNFYMVGMYVPGSNNIIDGNFINSTGTVGNSGIDIGGYQEYNKISNNVIKNIYGIGIELYGKYHTVQNNVIVSTGESGIFINDNYSIIVGNYISNITYNADFGGIQVDSGSYNVIDANGVYYCDAPGGSVGNGILIGTDSYNNTVVGNNCLFNESPFDNLGDNTYLSGNQFF